MFGWGMSGRDLEGFRAFSLEGILKMLHSKTDLFVMAGVERNRLLRRLGDKFPCAFDEG